MVRLAGVLAVLAAFFAGTSCGEFRRTVFPVNPNPPDPESLHFVLMLTDNGPDNPGTSNRIDVSGDTNVGTARVGVGPVHAALIPPNGSVAVIANRLEDTVSLYSTADATAVTTISLPAGSAPVFAHTTQSDRVYVANSGNATVSVISTGSRVVTRTIPVGSDPVALAETPNGSKLYVVNRGDSTVTAINTLDGTVSAAAIAVGASPTWAAARSDNRFVYVLGGGTVTTINTQTDTATASTPVAGATAAYYDRSLGRIYLTVPGPTPRLAVLNVTGDTPVALPSIDLSATCPGCELDAVTALPDGSKVYVASHITDASACAVVAGLPVETPPCVSTQVTAVRAADGRLLKTIPTMHRVLVDNQTQGRRPDVPVLTACVGLQYRRSIIASSDGVRVYVSNCDAGSVDIVHTSDDTFALDLIAPVSADPPLQGQDFPPPQRPVLVLSGR
jgi:YVTN family beta-propeller protein